MFIRVLLSINDDEPYRDVNIDSGEHMALSFEDFVDNIVIEEREILQRTHEISYHINDIPVSPLSFGRNIHDIFSAGDVLEIVFHTRPRIQRQADLLMSLLNDLRQSPRPGEADLQDVKVVLREEEFDKVGRETKESFDDLCAVCQEKQVKNEDHKILNCKHVFHKNCIKQWLTEQSVKCPLCKVEVSDKTRRLNMGEEQELMLRLPGGTEVETANPFAHRLRTEFEYVAPESYSIFNAGTLLNFLNDD